MGVSTLLRVDPPLCSASAFALAGAARSNFRVLSRTTGSQVPYVGLSGTHATFTPATARSIIRYSSDSSRTIHKNPVLMTVWTIMTLQQWFIRIRLCQTHLTCFHTFSPDASHPGSLPQQPRSDLNPVPENRVRGAFPSSYIQHVASPSWCLPLLGTLCTWSGMMCPSSIKLSFCLASR